MFVETCSLDTECSLSRQTQGSSAYCSRVDNCTIFVHKVPRPIQYICVGKFGAILGKAVLKVSLRDSNFMQNELTSP
jgi:hypothetical protein